MQYRVLAEKLKEAAASVLPVTAIVAVLCLALVRVDVGLMLSFLLGSGLLIVGMGLFTLGAELSMSRIGNLIGAKMTKSQKLWFVLGVSFLLGVAITMAEPDLQVLATNVPAIDKTVLVVTVSVGVGFFLMLCMARILFSISLRLLLIIFYTIVFIGAFLSDAGFLSVAFDSGGVTTGPMTVPFIMALGVGVASIRSDENAKADSFGLVALCSIGPVLAVMLLGAIYPTDTQADVSMIIGGFETSVDLGFAYLHSLPDYLLEVAMALLPIFVFFLLFQVFSLHLRKLPLMRIILGVGYTFLGLVLFLTGVNVGFSPLGYVLGSELVSSGLSVLLIPLAMLMGWFIIDAEPAVHILNKQVEELTSGAISAKAMGLSLSVAVALANGLAMVRVLTGLPILYFLVPGYAVALGLSFFVPRTFTAIAFDSGGVASGPLTATFMLPLAMGACTALDGNVMTDAFGIVALVAMMPLITVQVMGGIYVLKSKQKTQAPAMPSFGENEIIELWEAV
ncbi:Putative membrane-spanning protein [Oscillospiraceae bacterium]|nr:Putative membrane-spanning protein [Oscillospiraceae bacterium]